MNQKRIARFLWGVGDLVRDAFERGDCPCVSPRLLARIEADVRAVGKELVAMLREVAGA